MIKRAHQLGGLLGALFVLATPSIALACPYCAVGQTNSTANTMLLGAMIAFPFLIFLAVLPALRRAAQGPAGFSPMDTE